MDNLMYSLRITSKGKISDLTNGFELANGTPFSVFVKPKGTTMDQSTMVNCKLACDTEFGEFPVPLNDWTSGAIKKIAANGIDLSTYDVYWGAGAKVS